ncbi:InlB B-repeat-containing protein [Erysipelothrix sp. HDW6C]|uniref:InlB B-repeat-containing protein n=1 Tax=Erysipelothrix sp. HDW6C TaxID=2714930 RepID=UPI00140D4EDB|nr:InlB B-repeat-containing protein [Erysipelothrix sp. HDW6C]QIK69129.1 InlB B-repeat-containing protein [Erysipelothrix sp. HDW6C]
MKKTFMIMLSILLIGSVSLPILAIENSEVTPEITDVQESEIDDAEIAEDLDDEIKVEVEETTEETIIEEDIEEEVLEETAQLEVAIETTGEEKSTKLVQPVADTGEITNAIQLKAAIENATADRVIVLTADFDQTTLNNLIINKTNAHSIVVDGGGLTYAPTANKQFFIQSNTAGTLEFRNFIFDGQGTGVSGININGDVQGLTLENLTFKNNTSTSVYVQATGDVTINNNYYTNNSGAFGGGIEVSKGTILISNSSFISNRNDAGGYDGGAIAGKDFLGNLTITNSKFIDNHATGAGAVAGGRGGAIAMVYAPSTSELNNSQTLIKDSYFEGNTATLNRPTVMGDGGAIAVINLKKNATFTVEGSTFAYNEAGDDGGAILFQGRESGGIFTVKNSTFFKNAAHGNGGDAGLSGGAIQLFANSSMTANFISNTFVENTAYAYVENQGQRGGAVAGSGSFLTGRGQYANNLFVNNHVYSSPGVEDTESKYRNIVSATNKLGNVGFDNGTTIQYTTNMEAFGTDTPQLAANGSVITAGSSGDAIVVPTLMIAPDTGLNETGAISPDSAGQIGDLAYDQRGKLNGTDAGSVEIAVHNYNANGGTFALDAMGAYTGDIYYLGTEPTNYYNISENGGSGTVLTGSSLNATRAGYTFLGWATTADATVADITEGDSIPFNVENTILYAVWKQDVEYTVTYDGNQSTSGSVPTGTTQLEDTDYTVLANSGNLARDGYTFTGWNTAANGTGTPYKADDVFSLTGNVTLYAQWEEIPVVVTQYTVTYNGNGAVTGTLPVSSSIDAGTDYSVLGNVGYLSRPGFTFAGWNTAADGKGTPYQADDIVTQHTNTVLYAQWKQIPDIQSVSVMYLGNGADAGSVPNGITVPAGTQYTIIGNTGKLSKTGYTFSGWNTKADGTGTAYAGAEIIQVTADITLYAQWTAQGPKLPSTGIASQGLEIIGFTTAALGMLFIIIKKHNEVK